MFVVWVMFVWADMFVFPLNPDIYIYAIWRICIFHMRRHAPCVGGSPCSYKNAFSLLIAVYSLG